ncbi:MAG TPA: Asp23/Gls24 family envelope stress response protein [Candidatus Scybalocola faecipullorum]|nr:Asp23/Gls24 family envelope stress response protein [Candidatus Scybalocola faecipullorum]
MKGQVTTDTGNITIDLGVIAKYAGLAAVDCFGIVGMAVVSMKDGWAKLLKRENLAKGIDVSVRDNELYFDFHVIVSYGVSIATVADNLMSTVKYKVETFTGMKVGAVNVFVEGVRVID